MNGSITITGDLAFTVVGFLLMLVCTAACWGFEVWLNKDAEKQAYQNGHVGYPPFPGVLWFACGLVGVVLFVVGVGHAFYLGAIH